MRVNHRFGKSHTKRLGGVMKHKRALTVEFCAAVAKLHVAGWSNERICLEFSNHSKHDIPAAIERAIELGFLTRPKLLLSACRKKGISTEQIDAMILGARLTAGLRSISTCLREVHVFYPSVTTDRIHFDRRLTDFAPFAAHELEDILNHSTTRTIGVSWGLSSRLVVDAMAKIESIKRAKRKVFPIAGLPLHKYA